MIENILIYSQLAPFVNAMSDQNQPSPPATQNSTEVVGVLKKIDTIAPKGWRMKIARAAAQLIAGSEKGAIAYGEVRERLDTIEGRSTVSKLVAEAVAQQAINDPDLMERAKARFLGNTFQKQQNLEAVINGASEQLLALPPPSSENPIPDDAPKTKEFTNADEEISDPLDPDWAATFSDLAENATSEELRDRLSRVLAGELASPGTYTRSTVRLISELERDDLEAVQKVLPYVLGDLLVRTRGESSMPDHDSMFPLAEAGLLVDASGMLSKTWPTASDEQMPIGVEGNDWLLAITLNKGHNFTLPMAQLTRAGQAVVDLLGRPDEREILKRIAQEAPIGSFSKIIMGRRLGGGRFGPPTVQLFPEVASISVTTNFSASPFKPPNL